MTRLLSKMILRKGESHVKLLRLLAINSAGNVAFAVDLLALYTRLRIVLYLDNICNEKKMKNRRLVEGWELENIFLKLC